MPRISNLKSEYIPGFENPMTSYEISLDEDPPSTSPNESGGPKLWRNVQWINSAGDGYGPHATTFGDIADKIPPKPSLKTSCEKCRKRPDQNGLGYSLCAACKVARYCSRECQKSHWKEHKHLCQTRVKHVGIERGLEAEALRTGGPFVSQAALRKWYYDNIDIVDYAIVQTLELYKGRARSLWSTHAVVFALSGGARGTSVAADEMSFRDAEAASFVNLGRKDTLDLSPLYLNVLGAGSRIMLIFILNGETEMILVDSHDLPTDEEWAGMEKDEMWRMHIRMRSMAQTFIEKDSAKESE